MAKLTYYATRLSQNISETPEGYILARNVPICRSGFQEYLGSEIMRHPDYKSEWALDPDTLYKVFRPKDEVTSAATVASFEGKSLADEHPPEHIAPGSLIDVETDSELSRGHIQNVRVGDELEDGEACLLADVFIKNSDLVRKVIDNGVRQVSCGYTYKLQRSADGTLSMTDIRGNHLAVVPKGRAGSQIAIGDSAPPEIHGRKEKTMKILDHIFGRGLKDYAKDATPEELASAVREVGAATDCKPSTTDAEEDMKKKAAADKAAKDAEEAEEKKKADKAASDKAVKDAAEAEEKEKADKAVKDAEAELEDVGESAVDAEAEAAEKKKKDDGDKAAADKAAADKAAKDAADVLEPTTEVDETGKKAIGETMDAVSSFMKTVKPVVARIAATPKAKRSASDQAIVDGYNDSAKKIKALKGIADANGGYSALAHMVAPEGSAAAADSAPKLKSPSEFFAGRTHKEGSRLYNEYLATLNKEKN